MVFSVSFNFFNLIYLLILYIRVTQQNSETASCIRKLHYAMTGLYKDMCRGTILNSLSNLCDVPKTEEKLTEVCKYILFFYKSTNFENR